MQGCVNDTCVPLTITHSEPENAMEVNATSGIALGTTAVTLIPAGASVLRDFFI
jgi:hypothetical protein